MSLLDLPAELVISVSSYLNTKELGLLRRSCKHVEKHLFESFAKEFFTKRQFMIEHASLKTLVEISNHPILSQRLEEVLISTDMFDDALNMDPKYSLEFTSREWLLRSGQARDMLAEAFSKLKSLRSVGLRDYNAIGRSREGPDGLWRSYGWSANPTVSRPLKMDHNPSSLFFLILSALGSASAYPPDIQVILRKGNSLNPHAFRINAINAPVVARLHSLNVSLQAEADDVYKLGVLQSDAPLRRLLYTAADLKALRLNFGHRRPPASRLLDWLSTAPAPTDRSLDSPLDMTVPPASLSNLTSLDIGMVTVSTPLLIRVLVRFKLQIFSLWKVTLQCTNQLQTLTDHWSQFLADLSNAANSMNDLHTANIGFIAQIHRSSGSDKHDLVKFCPEGTDTEDKAKIDESGLANVAKFHAQYGLGVSDWLKALADRTYVRSLHAPPLAAPNSQSEASDQSDDGESDDEGEDDASMEDTE